LEVPSGVEGIVIDTQRFSRRASMTEEERKAIDKEHKEIEKRYTKKIADQFRTLVEELGEILDKKELKDPETGKALAVDKDDDAVVAQALAFKFDQLDVRTPDHQHKAKAVVARHTELIQAYAEEKERKLNSLKRGDELPSGVQQMVKVYVATKRVISVGDKM